MAAALRWVLILFQFLWLNIVIPGHTRGMVTMTAVSGGGGGSSGGGAMSCHEVGKPPSCCGGESAPRPAKSPTSEQKQNCAVCYFAGVLSSPPPVVFWQPCLGLRQILEVQRPQTPSVTSIVLPIQGRAPPAVV